MAEQLAVIEGEEREGELARECFNIGQYLLGYDGVVDDPQILDTPSANSNPEEQLR